jgi:short-subunit dehydrogenase
MGLGAAFAEALAFTGLDVVLLDRDTEALRIQAERLRERFPGVKVREQVADLAEKAEVDAVLEDLREVEIGLLVACAAHSRVGPWLEVTLEEKVRQIQVNCVSVTALTDRLSRPMAARGRGGIIVVSSMAGQLGTLLVSTYAATKAFDLVLGESLWVELRRHGVDVLALMPGPTSTPGFEGSLPSEGKMPAGLRVMKPEAVVREALDALGTRPSLVAGRWNRVGGVLVQRILPRKTAVEFMARSMRSLYARKSP